MKIVITGGCGFLGVGIARKLMDRPEIDSLVLFDAHVPDALPNGLDDRVTMVEGDISDRVQVAAIIDRDDIGVFHLASVVSAGGEQDFDLAMRVNFDGGRHILEALRARKGTPRIVLASSLAVFGGPDMPEAVTEMTRVVPQTTYGMTKAIGELMINDYTRKGFIDGRAARLPTVIIRPGAPNAAASGFASGVFREPLSGQDYVLPVAMDTRMMVIGARSAIAGLTGLMDADGEGLGADRVVNLPNNAYAVTDMIAALERVAAENGITFGPVTPKPDPAIEAIVKSWPLAMEDSRARALGLPADESLEAIIREYIADWL
ncbi:MAG TPA: NAD-dependent epimerase/dehydratase family protein [Rhodospirillales bacterium]|jgi:nucleoside-diphosphate-sugar epimerase|nr:MAG: putative epimerase/dehydratase [Alphaproteobacteria bacterium MarineAlpha3_Bin2]HIM77643.1 NAD-dependent epimerase/dehydratase family protein [Rhodospirillales bacterium]